MSEPEIKINGVTLTVGQAMTVRVALQSFACSMAHPNALGDDEHGRMMVKAYIGNVAQINNIIAKTTEDENDCGH